MKKSVIWGEIPTEDFLTLAVFFFKGKYSVLKF